MKKNCNIIRDLLPIYIDKVCSSETKKLVEEHLKECNECQEYAKNLKGDIKVVKNNEVKVFKDFIKKINFKIIRKTLLFTGIIVGVVFGALIFASKYKFYTDYDEGMDILLLGTEKRWNFQFVTPYLSRVRATYVSLNENGEKVNVVFINNKISLYEYLNVDKNGRPGTGPDLDYNSISLNDKMLVYYTKEDRETINNASKEELNEIIANAHLIFTNEKKTSEINCTLNGMEYRYDLTYYTLTEQIIDSNGEDTMPLDLLIDVYTKGGREKRLNYTAFDDASDVFRETEDYFTSKGGVCSITDIG